MAISNELSSEIASAILLENKTPQELKQLKEIILEVHSALQKLSESEKAQRFLQHQPSSRTQTKH